MRRKIVRHNHQVTDAIVQMSYPKKRINYSVSVVVRMIKEVGKCYSVSAKALLPLLLFLEGGHLLQTSRSNIELLLIVL